MSAFEGFLFEHEPAVRLAAFAGVFALMMGAERIWPARAVRGRLGAAARHLALTFANSLVLRFLMPVLAVGAAAAAAEEGLGLLARVDLPVAAEWIVALLLLDLAVYAQHIAMHKVPLLWRIHRVHHSDTSLDASTALRFHPLEIVLSMALKVVLVVAIGAPVGAVILFEIALNAAAMFNHANVALAPRLEAALRPLIITPALHRIHHSTEAAETNSNFGFSVSLWDRLFGTLRRASIQPGDTMPLGLATYRDITETSRLAFMLALPFRGRKHAP